MMQRVILALDNAALGRQIQRRLVVDCMEQKYLAGILTRTGGRVGETARLSGMEPRFLHQKMRRHGLRKEDFKPGPERGG